MTGKSPGTARKLAAGQSRRQMITMSLVALGGLAGARIQARQTFDPAGETRTIRDGKAIHYEVEIHAHPQRIYEALLDAKQFKAFSDGRSAEIHPTVGGAFSIFGGHIFGRFIELIPARRIIQAWRVENWTEGLYSIANFEFRALGAGTKIIFDHTGFPPEEADDLADGWQEHYWNALGKYLV